MPPDTTAFNHGRFSPPGRGGFWLRRASITGCLLAALLPSVLHAGTGGEAAIRVIAQHPDRHGELALGEPHYLRIAYDSSQPLRFQARAPKAGADGARMNPAPLYPEGRGEALAWLAFRVPADVDEVDIQVLGGDGRALPTLRVPQGFVGLRVHRHPGSCLAGWMS